MIRLNKVNEKEFEFLLFEFLLIYGLVHVWIEHLENLEYTHIHLNVFYFEFLIKSNMHKTQADRTNITKPRLYLVDFPIFTKIETSYFKRAEYK